MIKAEGMGIILILSRFRRKAFLKQKGEEVVQDVYAYGVASVVTPVEQHRTFLLI